MLRKFNRKMKASVKLLSGKGGFSLPELIIAVVILAIVSGAILYSFVSASNATIKATRLSEASDAAQNIQETLEAIGVTSFQSGNEDLLKYLNITEDDFEFDEDEQTATILNLESGGNKYDAKVNFSTGTVDTVEDGNGNTVIDLSTADGFYLINNKEISHYDARAVVFQQNQDYTDDAADREFYSNHPSDKIIDKNREVELTIDCEEDEEGNPEIITFKCIYRYIIRYSEIKIDTDPPIYEPAREPCIVERTQTIADAPLSEFGDSVPLYFRYYPCYADAVVREKNTFFKDTFIINNEKDLPVTVFLVKQKPEVKLDDGTYEVMNDTLLNSCETLYTAEIFEYHSYEYIHDYDIETAYSTLLTNAGKNLVTEEVRPITIGYHLRAKAGDKPDREKLAGDKIKEGKLISKTKFNRMYDVTINIYKSGESDSENPTYTLNFKGNYIR